MEGARRESRSCSIASWWSSPNDMRLACMFLPLPLPLPPPPLDPAPIPAPGAILLLLLLLLLLPPLLILLEIPRSRLRSLSFLGSDGPEPAPPLGPVPAFDVILLLPLLLEAGRGGAMSPLSRVRESFNESRRLSLPLSLSLSRSLSRSRSRSARTDVKAGSIGGPDSASRPPDSRRRLEEV